MHARNFHHDDNPNEFITNYENNHNKRASDSHFPSLHLSAASATSQTVR